MPEETPTEEEGNLANSEVKKDALIRDESVIEPIPDDRFEIDDDDLDIFLIPPDPDPEEAEHQRLIKEILENHDFEEELNQIEVDRKKHLKELEEELEFDHKNEN